jgi:hypothetical protein
MPRSSFLGHGGGGTLARRTFSGSMLCAAASPAKGA